MNKISTPSESKVSKQNLNKENKTVNPSTETLNILRLFARTYNPNQQKEFVLN